MSFVTYFFFFLLIFTSWFVRPEDNLQSCALLKDTSTKFSITNRRNQTGHWTTQINLHRSSQQDSSEPSSAVDVVVEQDTSICHGLETVNIITTVTVPPLKPFPDYNFFPYLGYYKIHTVGQTWKEAAKTCASEGAHLAVVNSEDEATILKHLFSKHVKIPKVDNNDNAFIGYHDMYAEGEYTTIFGDPLNSTGFSRWVPGQPNNAAAGIDPDSDCGGIHRSTGGMNDLPCNWKLSFFCEQELW